MVHAPTQLQFYKLLFALKPSDCKRTLKLLMMFIYYYNC